MSLCLVIISYLSAFCKLLFWVAYKLFYDMPLPRNEHYYISYMISYRVFQKNGTPVLFLR